MKRLLVAGLLFAGPAQAADFAGVVDRAIEGAILPAFAAFAQASAAQAERMEALCAAPSAAALAAARAGFGELVQAYGGVALYRLGPMRVDNRLERLFFWPDRRGRGVRQIETLLTTEDPTAMTREGVQAKSVAVQGLAALERALFGKGGAMLAHTAGHRCAYGSAVAAAIADIAVRVNADWRGDEGFGAVMRAAGPGNATFADAGEAVRALIRVAGEQIQIVAAFKLARAVGDGMETAKPKRGPLWRSGVTIAMMAAEIDGVRALLAAADFAAALPENRRNIPAQIDFELANAMTALADAQAFAGDFAETLADDAAYGRLAYARFPLAGAISALNEQLPGALGLIIGFNALDGD